MKPRIKTRLDALEQVVENVGKIIETLHKDITALREDVDDYEYLENNIILCQAKICEYVQELDDAAKAQRIVAELNNLLEREK
jgi:hypothetical protein